MTHKGYPPRGHQRHSHPFDKMMPLLSTRGKTTAQSKVDAKMHNKKQRQHNKNLCKNGE